LFESAPRELKREKHQAKLKVKDYLKRENQALESMNAETPLPNLFKSKYVGNVYLYCTTKNSKTWVS
jgi:hypothetical protein